MRLRLFLLLAFLLAATPCKAQEVDVIHPSPWVVLADPVRVTYYGSKYIGGEITAAGIRYMPDNDTCALGPELLHLVREFYANEANSVAGDPGYTVTTKRWSYVSVAGGFPLLPCWGCIPVWWGYVVRIGDPASGKSLICRVMDTGSRKLDVDLPDQTWLRFGYPASHGVFMGTVEVLRTK